MTDIEKIILEEMATMKKDIRKLLEFRWRFAATLIFLTLCFNMYSEYSRAKIYEKFDKRKEVMLHLNKDKAKTL